MSTGQLALVEAKRLLRSPLVLGAAALMLVQRTVQTWTSLPVWEDVAADTEYAVVFLALATMLAAHLAASRDHRYGMAETTATLPMPARRRTLALLALLPAAALVAAATVGVHLLSLAPSGFVGPFDAWDLLASVALPVLAAAAGIVLAGWLASTTAAVLGTLAAGLIPGIANFVLTDGSSRMPQLSPVLPSAHSVQPAVPLRLTGWHLVYLLGLITVAIGATLVRHRRRLVPVVAIGVGLAVAGTAAAVKFTSYSTVVTEVQMRAATAPSAYRCQRHGAVTYCAYPGYTGFIPKWQGAVAPVVAAIPESGRHGLPPVRQISGSYSIDPHLPPVVRTPTAWGRWGSSAGRSREQLTTSYSLAAVGLPHQYSPPIDNGRPVGSCWAGSQPRTVVALWLAAQADPEIAAKLRAGKLELPVVEYGRPEAAAATALLSRPRTRVTAALGPVWNRLDHPDVLTTLGLPALPSSHGRDGSLVCR